MQKNWSRFGFGSNKESQPNTEFLNKYKAYFPDFEGVCKQVAQIVEMERNSKRDAYLAKWEGMSAEDKLGLSFERYIKAFGQKSAKQCLLFGDGLHPTIKGIRRNYDCFDLMFRQLTHVKWNVYFDTDDTSRVLAVNGENS